MLTLSPITYANSLEFSESISNQKQVNNLRILEVGAWTNGNDILYIKFDKAIGPSECNSNFVKIDLSGGGDSQKEIMATSMVRSMALTALVANLKGLVIRVLPRLLIPKFQASWVYKVE